MSKDYFIASDIPSADLGGFSRTVTSSELESELLGQKSVKEIITNIEEQMGRTAPIKLQKFTIVNKILNLGKAEDSEFLSELMNNPDKYQITYQSQNWSNFGDLKMFVIYKEFVSKSTDKKNE